MPAIRLTIASNAKQSQRAPLLVPSTATFARTQSLSVCALVLKTAQTKLRLKKPTRIFLGGTGQELLTEDDWKANIKDDVMLLVSTGEDYVGLKRESKHHAEANPDCPVELLASRTPVEALSVTQLVTTAHDLPGIVHAVGQPDLHPGTKFPIGAVFGSQGWIHPPLIGSDIGCGMAWYKTTLSRSQVDGDKGKKVAEKSRGLEGPWRTQAHRETWLQGLDVNYSAGEEWDKSLGTIGAGNHFAELQVVEEASSSTSGLKENDVILLVHSGSRGYGGSILKKFTTTSKLSFKENSPEAIQYMKEHDRACQWAKANRDLIALRFLSCLEPGNEDWEMGSGNSANTVHTGLDRISKAREVVQGRKVVDIWHNNVERVTWPPSNPAAASSAISSIAGIPDAAETLTLHDASPKGHVFVHRKGAAPTYHPDSRQALDLLPLPGSRGTSTLILRPSLSETNSWGLKNALSLAHGAGRAMSRAKALSSLAQKYKGQNILEPRTSDSEGTWVICDEKDLVWEEAPEAYKDVQAVGQDLVDAGVATILGWCRARVSYKVRNEAR